MKPYHLIFLRDSKVILSKKSYLDWKEVQTDYHNYMSSLDFDSTENVIEYLTFDYKIPSEIIKNKVEEIESTELEHIELKL